jgi:integrase
MRDVAKPRVRPLTFEQYACDVRLQVEPGIGRIRLDKLQPAHLVALHNAKRAAGLSPSSIRHLDAVIRRALAVAVRWRLVGVNVATLVDKPDRPTS